jgi:Tol biopolymer transport system component
VRVGLTRLSGVTMGWLAVAIALTFGAVEAVAGSPARIAFSSGGRIFTIAADGASRHRVTGPARPLPEYEGDLVPDISPDGTEVAFARLFTRRDGDTGSAIYAVDVAGGQRHALTHGDRAIDYAPRWSPTGDLLAFVRIAVSESRVATKIMVADSDGGHPRAVAKVIITERSRTFSYLWEPSWDPDGAHLVYTRVKLLGEEVMRPSLFRVATGGGHPRLLRRDASAASYSPDGSRIAFTGTGDRDAQECSSDECAMPGEIYVMRADGTHARRLTRNRGNDAEPDWSADGRRIAFHSDRNQPAAYSEAAELYSIRPNGSCLTWLTNGAPPSASPDWEPDASASTDPGACGATHRPPLVETDVRPARHSGLPTLWLGRRYGSRLLTSVRGRPHGPHVGLSYDDCGLYSPRLCQPPLRLSEHSVCAHGHLLAEVTLGHRLRERRGVLVARRAGGVSALTGRAVIDIRLEDEPGHGSRVAGELNALGGLRRLGETRRPRSLSRTRLPAELVRRVRLAEVAHRRSGSLAAVAEALGVTRYEAHGLLRLARALDRYGHVGRVPCAAGRASLATGARPGNRSSASRSLLTIADVVAPGSRNAEGHPVVGRVGLGPLGQRLDADPDRVVLGLGVGVGAAPPLLHGRERVRGGLRLAAAAGRKREGGDHHQGDRQSAHSRRS